MAVTHAETTPTSTANKHKLQSLSHLHCRLLSSFQNNLDEITIIATPDGDDGDGQTHLPKAVQLHSFLDPAKGMTLNCQTDSIRVCKNLVASGSYSMRSALNIGSTRTPCSTSCTSCLFPPESTGEPAS